MTKRKYKYSYITSLKNSMKVEKQLRCSNKNVPMHVYVFKTPLYSSKFADEQRGKVQSITTSIFGGVTKLQIKMD